MRPNGVDFSSPLLKSNTACGTRIPRAAGFEEDIEKMIIHLTRFVPLVAVVSLLHPAAGWPQQTDSSLAAKLLKRFTERTTATAVSKESAHIATTQQPAKARSARATKPDRGTSAALDISFDDFSSKRPRVFSSSRSKEAMDDGQTADTSEDQNSESVQEEAEQDNSGSASSFPRDLGSVMPEREKKPSLRNVGYTYDPSGNRVYEDGSVTDQSGTTFYKYGSKVRWE